MRLPMSAMRGGCRAPQNGSQSSLLSEVGRFIARRAARHSTRPLILTNGRKAVSARANALPPSWSIHSLKKDVGHDRWESVIAILGWPKSTDLIQSRISQACLACIRTPSAHGLSKALNPSTKAVQFLYTAGRWQPFSRRDGLHRNGHAHPAISIACDVGRRSRLPEIWLIMRR